MRRLKNSKRHRLFGGRAFVRLKRAQDSKEHCADTENFPSRGWGRSQQDHLDTLFLPLDGQLESLMKFHRLLRRRLKENCIGGNEVRKWGVRRMTLLHDIQLQNPFPKDTPEHITYLDLVAEAKTAAPYILSHSRPQKRRHKHYQVKMGKATLVRILRQVYHIDLQLHYLVAFRPVPNDADLWSLLGLEPSLSPRLLDYASFCATQK